MIEKHWRIQRSNFFNYHPQTKSLVPCSSGGRDLSRGSLSEGSLSGGSLSEGSLSGESLLGKPHGQSPPPHTVKSGRYASYWNALLFPCSFRQKLRIRPNLNRWCPPPSGKSWICHWEGRGGWSNTLLCIVRLHVTFSKRWMTSVWVITSSTQTQNKNSLWGTFTISFHENELSLTWK